MTNEEINSQYRLRTGIKNYHEKSISYPKFFNNNCNLAYDEDAIYVVDKLQLSYTTNYSSIHFKNLLNYNKSDDLIYELEEYIAFQKNNRNRIEYGSSYLIVVSGYTFGTINMHHHLAQTKVNIDITNQFLYIHSGYEIASNLFKISNKLNLNFSNVSNYELARDSIIDFYHKYGLIYYQSDFCPKQVYDVYGGEPRYSKYGKTNYTPIIPDDKNNKYGTAYIGNDKSVTQIKLYSKYNELANRKARKNYITQIHLQHFGNQEITRVEARVKSFTINKSGFDLFDLLNPERHKELFYHFVGNKLTFKDLTTRTWDKNNNPKYELINLLPDSVELEVKNVSINPKPYHTHNIHLNKMKNIIFSFLDEEINVFAVDGFLSNSEFSSHWKDNLDEEFLAMMKSYKNPINNTTIRKWNFIKQLLNSNGSIIKKAKAYFNYLF